MVDHLVTLEGIEAAGSAAEVSPAVDQILGRPAEPYAAFLDREFGLK